jgi:hypothetical protein
MEPIFRPSAVVASRELDVMDASVDAADDNAYCGCVV